MGTIRQDNKSLYWAWKGLKQRCNNKQCKSYPNYGGRGITVCKDWTHFEPFFKWAINNGYKKGLDLDRKDNNGNYEPNNCRWISRADNINNRRKTILLTINGETKSRTQWEKAAGITAGAVKSWVINHGKEYAEKRIKKILEEGYIPKDYGYSHRKSVVHQETKMKFNSVKEAADHFGIAPCTISNAIRENKATGKGRFQWEEIS